MPANGRWDLIRRLKVKTGYKWLVRSTKNDRTTFYIWHCCSKRQIQIPLITTEVSKWTPMFWTAVSQN